MQAKAAAYSGPHRLVLNRNPKNLGIVPHVEKVMALASGALIVENAGDDVSVPHRVARMVEAWLASGRRAKAIHTARRRMDANGDLHEVFDDAPGAREPDAARGDPRPRHAGRRLARLGPRGLGRLRAAVAGRDLRRLPDLLPRER